MILINKGIYGDVQYLEKISGVPGLGWYLLSTNPNPPTAEVNNVVYDIINDNKIGIEKGRLRHLPNCQVSNHKIRSKIIKEALLNLKEINFTIAIYYNGKNILLQGQPIAIALSPEISRSKYPDHPHLNVGGNFNNFFYPSSLCYTNNPAGLGDTNENRLSKALDYIIIWLFRHQLWLLTKEINGKGIWIGPQENVIVPNCTNFESMLNDKSLSKIQKLLNM